jgi:hypothetical protein
MQAGSERREGLERWQSALLLCRFVSRFSPLLLWYRARGWSLRPGRVRWWCEGEMGWQREAGTCYGQIYRGVVVQCRFGHVGYMGRPWLVG